MKVILREDVKKLGRAGDAVKVADGFGRNYLLPKKLAMTATLANIQRTEQELNSKKGQARRLKKDAEYQAETIAAKPLTIVSKVGEGGKLFGSVTTADIEKELEGRGITLDKRKIVLDEPIKTAGTHHVTIKLHPEVTAELTILVQSEEPKPETAKPEAVKPEAVKTEAEAVKEATEEPEA